MPAYEDFANTAVTADVMSNPVSQFDQTMGIAAGRTAASASTTPSSRRGLVGQVTKVLRDTALVTLLTDKESAVTAGPSDRRDRHRPTQPGPEDLLFLERVKRTRS